VPCANATHFYHALTARPRACGGAGSHWQKNVFKNSCLTVCGPSCHAQPAHTTPYEKDKKLNGKEASSTLARLSVAQDYFSQLRNYAFLPVVAASVVCAIGESCHLLYIVTRLLVEPQIGDRQIRLKNIKDQQLFSAAYCRAVAAAYVAGAWPWCLGSLVLKYSYISFAIQASARAPPSRLNAVMRRAQMRLWLVSERCQWKKRGSTLHRALRAHARAHTHAQSITLAMLAKNCAHSACLCHSRIAIDPLCNWSEVHNSGTGGHRPAQGVAGLRLRGQGGLCDAMAGGLP
jgi:hypothetical protein